VSSTLLKDVPEDIKKIAVNIYRRQAPDIELLTNMRFLLKNKVISKDEQLVIDIPVSFHVKELLKLDFNQLEFKFKAFDDLSRLVSLKFKFKTLMKVFVNKLFYIFGELFSNRSNYIGNSQVIRTWVDVSIHLFQSEITKSYVLIYPFSINIKRQLLYIRSLREKKIQFQITGFSYSLINTIIWIFSRQDMKYFLLERDAYKHHSNWMLAKKKLKTLLTTDEFEPGSFILNKELMKNNITVINKAHGIGKYSPYINYNKFFVFNTSQVKYYSEYSSGIEFSIYKREVYPQDLSNIKTLVFIDQLPEPDGSLLHISQLKAVKELEKVSKMLGIDFKVKLHPNVRVVAKEYEHLKYSGKAQDIILPAFFTFFSTAYLEFEEFAPTVLLKDEVYDPSIIFGQDARVVNVNRISELFNDNR
jgi:hypothetical protein